MTELSFYERDPNKGYITNNLLIPKGPLVSKRLLDPEQVKNSLSFIVGEEDLIEEDTGLIVGRKPREEKLWDETEAHLIVPRAYLTEEQRAALPIEWVEDPLYVDEIDIEDDITPRDETQVESLRYMSRCKGGTVNLACVAGDTKLSFNRGGKGFQMSIAKAYERLRGGRYRWDWAISTMVRAKMGNHIGLHRVDDIIYKGKRLTKTLVLEDGKRLRLTADHQVLTTKGWKSIDQGLKPGDLVYVDGERRESVRKPKKVYKRLSQFRHHPFARKQYTKRKGKKYISYVIEEHRAIAEASLNALSLLEFRERCRCGYTDGLQFIDPSIYHVHHIDEDVTNNHPDNLEVLEKEAHLGGHRPGAKAFGYGVPTPVKVKAIKEGKFEDVYDVVCKDPHHNFVANGIVVHNCGKGKTVVALKYWAMQGVPALVVVNTRALLHQWLLEIEEFFGDIPVGIIQGPKEEWEGYPISVAMVHTLSNKALQWPKKFRRYYGIIFYDEGHHLSAPHFVRSADLFFGQRFSLTATAGRTDGLEAIYQYHLGDVIYADLEQELIPDTIFHVLEYNLTNEQDRDCRDINGQMCHPCICGTLGRMDWRNDIVIDNLIEDLEEGRECLVLTHSVDHTRELHRLLLEAGYEGAGLINGEDTGPFERIPILRRSNPLVATFQLAREALNKPILDTLHVVTPFGNSNDLQQSWGRIQRIVKSEKCQPRVRVYKDMPIRTCRDQCRKLAKFLRALEYPSQELKESI